MKQLKRVFPFLLMLLLCLAVLPAAAARAETAIDTVSVKILSPIVGVSPDYTLDLPYSAHYYSANYSDTYFQNDIVWTDTTAGKNMPVSGSVFEDGHAYRVTIYLTPEDGYAFSSSPTCTVNGESVEYVVRSDGQLALYVSFPAPALPQSIDSVSVTITPPAIGASPDYHVGAPDFAPYYTAYYCSGNIYNDVVWVDDTTNQSMAVGSSVFEAGHAYHVIIYLTHDYGYVFSSSATCTVNRESVEYVVRSDGQLALYAYFRALPETTENIDTVSVTITPPAVGAGPDYTPVLPSGAHYYSADYSSDILLNDVVWFDSTAGQDMTVGSSVFEAGHAYFVTIYLTPDYGYVFSSSPACTVNGESAEYVVRYDGRIALYVSFSALAESGWKQNSTGWWYQRADGTYPKDQWEKIDNKWYHFDGSGYMQRGWLKLGNNWYYLGSAMVTGWQKINNVWYWFADNGAMQTGWQKLGNVWYYFASNGAMQTGWQKIGSSWYYFGSNGKMVTGWQVINGKSYFFKTNGAMAANEWCNGYWLNADGTFTYHYQASWHQNAKGWWYGDTSGWYAKSTTIVIDGKSYTFDANGYMK